ncbi:MAG TPA: DNA mismatch repair protein MutS [Polyangiaceae bacterium]
MRRPRDGHLQRKEELEHQARAYARTSRWISTFRLITFLAAFSLAGARGFGFLAPWASWLAGISGLAFILLVVWHARLDRAERRVAAAIAFHRWALERIDGKFQSYPARGDRFVSDTHPYTSDLGIFGEASVFQLIDSTHTRRGEDCLARWLSEPSSVETVVQRQGAVGELVRHETLREELAVLGTLISTDKPNPDPLLAWAEGEPAVSRLPLVRVLSFTLPTVTLLGFFVMEMGWLSAKVWLAWVAGQWIYSFALLPKVEPVAAAVSSREGALARYRSMLELVENESFETEGLRRLQNELGRSSDRASDAVRRLSKIVAFLDARHNEVFRLFIAPLVLWDLHCVLALEKWQAHAGTRVRRWLDVLGEVEALASLGGFAHDHPELAWPELSQEPAFRAKELGHPLIEPRARVCNDVELRGPGTALLVTGSNMSGKSTLLRSMGVNAVLAMAGAPVVARELVISSFEVRTSMWARDSLVKGVSHFYAELEKLKRVVDGMSTGRPLFFLLDEILQGTNSRERVIGARSVLRHLLENGAMGAVSTHDIGLLDLKPDLDRRLDKVHFEEQVAPSRDGVSTMSFDYRLRSGVVRSTNALRLMKMVGIDVDLE